MIGQEPQQTVLELLRGMGDPSSTSATRYDKFCRLFWTELNYQRVNQTLSRQAWNESAAKALVEDPSAVCQRRPRQRLLRQFFITGNTERHEPN